MGLGESMLMWGTKPRPRSLALIGGGTHAAVVREIIALIGRDIIVGIVDDALSEGPYGESLLGTRAVLPHLRGIYIFDVVMAIGDNQARRTLYLLAIAHGLTPRTVIHPSAVISPSATIGPGTVICAHAVVGSYARVGANVLLNTACTVDHHCVIGDHAHLAPGVHLGGGVMVPEGVLVPIGRSVPPNRTVVV